MPQHEVARFAPALVAMATLVLAACDRNRTPPAEHAPPIAPALARYTNHRFALAVSYPATLGGQRHAARGYLDGGRWKLAAGPHSRGRALLALTLPGSNHVTSATLSIGASRDPHAVRDCLQPPPGTRTRDAGAHIDGVPFTRYVVADGAMSHFLNASAYRAIHDGTCYAIDLRVTGTQPQVYDPPATPPFTRAAAMRRLHRLLGGIRFLDRQRG